MALAEMTDGLFADTANVCKNPHVHPVLADDEAMRLCRVVVFAKGSDGHLPQCILPASAERVDLRRWHGKTAGLERAVADIYWQAVFACDGAKPLDVVTMLVRNENSPDALHTEPEAGHALLRFATGNAGIHQYGVLLVADVVAVSVAAGIEGCNIERHVFKVTKISSNFCFYRAIVNLPKIRIAMIAQITDGVKVSVETVYQPEYSNPENDHFMFAYKVTIQNLGDYSVQLLRRHWHIFDSNGTHREVDGEGVVGLQPIIAPGEQHEYVSGCNLKSDVGSMEGTYQMLREVDGTLFDVEIPKFNLIAPHKLN